MSATTLKDRQGAIKDGYRKNPSSAITTLLSTGTLDSTSITCSLDSGPAVKDAKQRVAGLHKMAGGEDAEISGELCSGEMLLDALVACAGVTLKAVAGALKIPLKAGKIRAEGDLDFRGTLGVDKTTPVGLTSIRLLFDLEMEEGADVPEDKIAMLGSLTERYCVVLQTITNKPDVLINVQGKESAEIGVEKQYSWNHRC